MGLIKFSFLGKYLFKPSKTFPNLLHVSFCVCCSATGRQRQQAGPGFPATLVAGSGTRNWRGDPGGTGMSAELGLADPASLAWALPAADSGAGPPLHRGWARGTTPARDLGRKIGGDTEGEERERETDGRVSPTPWHATIWSSASWMARSSDAGRWHWTHCAVALGSRAINCSSTTWSMTWSTPPSPANSHLRQASRSW